MGVDLTWENENGGPIEEILDPQMCMSHLVLNTDLTGTTCLRFIDPYGDTIFNQLQIPILIDELQSILGKVQDDQIRDHLQRAIELAEKSRGEIHTYLKFHGD
jgi:hypothetical protein